MDIKRLLYLNRKPVTGQTTLPADVRPLPWLECSRQDGICVAVDSGSCGSTKRQAFLLSPSDLSKAEKPPEQGLSWRTLSSLPKP